MGDKQLGQERGEEDSYKIISGHISSFGPEYKNLIIAPFLNSLRYGNDLFKLVEQEAYYKNYAKYIELLINRPNTKIRMAKLSDNTVLGWSIMEDKTLHYVWVKKEQHRQGIATALVKEFDTISHITHKGINIWAKKFPNVRFNPFV